jgi:hypothetical protein
VNRTAEGYRRQRIDFVYAGLFLLVIVVAISIRTYISFFSGRPWFTTDTFSYFQMADAILAGHPYSHFPNGYPILVATIKLIFKSEMVPTVLIVLNVVLSTLVVGMVIDMARKMTGGRWLACLAGLGVALYPNQINYVRQLLTEVPATFLLTLSVFLLLKRKYFGSGLILYLAVLFRSSLLPVLPTLFICSLLHPIIRRIKVHFSYLGGFGISLALSSALLVAGIAKPSSNLGSDLLISIKSYSQNVNYSVEGFNAEERQHPLRTYIKFALNSPAKYIKQRILSLEELWGWPSAGDPPRSLAARILIAVRLPLLILAILGFYRRAKDFDAWVLFVPIVAITLVHVAMFSTPRFTYVVEPFLVILATMALNKKA